MNALKGWRTVGFGLLVAIGPSAVDYLGKVNWTDYVSPNVAAVITGVVIVALRAITSTSIGSKA